MSIILIIISIISIIALVIACLAFSKKQNEYYLQDSPINIVISRWKNNTDWSEKFKDIANVKILIYDKENPKNIYNIPVNKGNEASVYLKYIIDHYDTLPDFTFFIHDEEKSWHHKGSLIDRFKEALDSKKKYYNVNNFILGSILKKFNFKDIKKWYDKYIEKYIPMNDLPQKDWTQNYKGSAQFLVHKSLIQKFPIKFYKDLYNWIITTKISTYQTSRWLEWTWHLFWGPSKPDK